MEYPAGDNLVAYTAAGDMKLDLREQHTGTFHFPSCHYHGLTVAFDRNIVRESLPREVRDFPATPEKIIERWQLGSTPRVVRGAERMEHIFGEMYRVPEKIRIPYFKVKILELLLYLDAMTIPQVERASVLLQNAGRKGRGHQALFSRACGGKFHAGGAIEPLRHSDDTDEDVLPFGLRRGHRHVADELPHESGGRAAAERKGPERRRGRRACRLRQRGQIHRCVQKGHAFDAVGVPQGKGKTI